MVGQRGCTVKRGTPDHWKMKLLGKLLKVPDRYAILIANGIMVRLWEYTARNYPRGDIGSAPDWAIADACAWDCGKRADRCGQDSAKIAAFIDALVEAGWLDRDKTCRLLVHDWAEHAEFHVKRLLKEKGLPFFSPSPSSTSIYTYTSLPPTPLSEGGEKQPPPVAVSSPPGPGTPAPEVDPAPKKNGYRPEAQNDYDPEAEPPPDWEVDRNFVPIVQTAREFWPDSMAEDFAEAHRVWKRMTTPARLEATVKLKAKQAAMPAQGHFVCKNFARYMASPEWKRPARAAPVPRYGPGSAVDPMPALIARKEAERAERRKIR
jgi:hypothetical protein